MNITSYFKSTAPLEKREALLFKMIDELDKESFILFNEIVDLSDESYYKLESLATRIISLIKIYKEIDESFEYINKIEESSYDYAAKRFQLKRTLIAITTVYASIVNFILGITSFVVLNDIASKEFIDELNNINDKLSEFDKDKLIRIRRTLENTTRLFCGKLKRIANNNELTDSNNMLLLIIANDYIKDYIEGNIPTEKINFLSDKIKDRITSILKKDLNIDNNNIYELLNIAKKNNQKRLIKHTKTR